MQIAVATGTPPAGWRAESDEVLATVIDVLAEQTEQMKGR